ncbi:hypothetical protein OZX73_07775 [Bifidobacterium sp. ESL0775]|uniref:hypothetical protein n=1 Tax=Bifidobacterium sp. ESL0775 TaxID=2983230 RepID=UPI0023F64F31|nr:hypothetical protein [Bifidobacterium sp. ESL0775]WEV69143.1 hypothetical protein OZX73_07775 [Bifidobacterium sp. ESL0775]
MTSTQDEQRKPNAKPTKHATIMRGVVAPIFGLLAVLFIVLGALNATIWKPASEVTADTSISGTRYVVTDPGVLNLLGKTVNVKVGTTENRKNAGKSAPKTCVAQGSSKDAMGWLAGQSYTRITGLHKWKTLTNKTAKGQKLASAGAAGDEVAFKDSDMWTSVSCGNGTIPMTLNDVKADQVVVIDTGVSSAKSASDASSAAGADKSDDASQSDTKESGKKATQPKLTITMHWVRDKVPNHALPFFIAAGVCVLLTVLSITLFAISANESVKRKREARREKREAAKAEEVSISEAMTGSIAVLRTSIAHTSHNHRPSHKVASADTSGASDADIGTNGDDNVAASTGSMPANAGGDADDETPSIPSIIDPTRRNLVADMQMRDDGDESTNPKEDGGAGNGFGRHRGKAEQEPESNGDQETQVGRHSRPSEDGEKNVAPVPAPVAVSLDESSRTPDDVHAANGDGEGRRTSSADAMIDEGHTEDETGVITPDELRAYFARFSQEDTETDNDSVQDGEDKTTDETDEGQTTDAETDRSSDDVGDEPQDDKGGMNA